MKTNTEKAVLIIAALSLLLGLSLGQIQHQHQTIQQLRSEAHPKQVVMFKKNIDNPFKTCRKNNWNADMAKINCKIKIGNEKLKIKQQLELKQLEKDLRVLEIEQDIQNILDAVEYGGVIIK